MARKKIAPQDELLKEVQAVIDDDAAPPTAKARMLELKARLLSRLDEPAPTIGDEEAPDPMLDLDELSVRRRKRTA